MQTGYLNKIDR